METIKNKIQHWWINLLLGILLIVVGVWVFLTPLQGYLALTLLFSIAMLVSGITEIVFSITNRREYEGWKWALAGGILDLILGLVLVMYPAIPIIVLPFYVAFWLMFRGIMAIGTSLTLKSIGEKNWLWLLLWGIGILLFSILLFANPIIGGFGIIIMTAISFIAAGIYNISLAFRLRKIHHLIVT